MISPWIWISLHHHPVVWGRLRPRSVEVGNVIYKQNYVEENHNFTLSSQTISYSLLRQYLSQFMGQWQHEHKGRFTPWTMNSDHGIWPFLHVPTSWSNFHDPISLKIQFAKSFGPSLSLNQMWTNRNDHALNNECVYFFQYMSKKGIFEKEKEIKINLDHSLGFSCLHLFSP